MHEHTGELLRDRRVDQRSRFFIALRLHFCAGYIVVCIEVPIHDEAIIFSYDEVRGANGVDYLPYV